MDREYTYAELCRMKKKRVIRIAGYKNLKDMYKDGVGRTVSIGMDGQPFKMQDTLSKKYIARMMASDR